MAEPDDTNTAIANMALAQLKQPAITSLAGDTTATGGMLRLYFPFAMSRLLEIHPWAETLKTATLDDPTSIEDRPPFSYTHALPEDFGYMVHATESGTHENLHIPTMIEDGKLFAHCAFVSLLYVPATVSTEDLPSHLKILLADLLAYEVSWPLIGSADTMAAMERRISRNTMMALATDARRTGTPSPIR